jgi:antitoxin component YwqK of YwqJK toxin-antitoxin module
MKNTILILISLLVFTGVIEGKEVTYLQDRNGIKYEVNSEVGYTGKYVEWYRNGQKKVEENYVDGKLDGVVTYWYENGQKFFE